jgi:hypothetical protein
MSHRFTFGDVRVDDVENPVLRELVDRILLRILCLLGNLPLPINPILLFTSSLFLCPNSQVCNVRELG